MTAAMLSQMLLEAIAEAVDIATVVDEEDDDAVDEIGTLEPLVFPADDDVIDDVQTFEERGLVTRDNGFVLSFSGGDEFQVTIVQSKYSDRE